MKWSLLILLAVFGGSAVGQVEPPSPSLIYLIRQPKIKSEKPPLIVLIHGFGANEFDLFSFADQLPGKFLVISARAPNTVDEGRYSWYRVDPSSGMSIVNDGAEKKSREVVIQFIESIKQQFKINDQQIFLCGFSQGAGIAFSVGLTRPDLVRGIAAMSGRLLDQIKPDIADKNRLQSLRIFISHGVADDRVNIQEGRNSKLYLESIGVIPLYKEYPDGHSISKKMIVDLSKWLNKFI